jgi:hypothetical protein
MRKLLIMAAKLEKPKIFIVDDTPAKQQRMCFVFGYAQLSGIFSIRVL